MTITQLWHRSVSRKLLRHAAQRYADHGWRVVPGAALLGGRYVCGPLCPTVSCHPAVDDWETYASSRSADVRAWWSESPYSVLLATGHAFDVIEVPAWIGAAVARMARPGPVAVSPAGRWMFLTAPGGCLRPELSDHLDVVWHGVGSWIPAPPTRTPAGRIRWHVHPAVTGWRLPNPHTVQKFLVAQIPRASRPATFSSRAA